MFSFLPQARNQKLLAVVTVSSMTGNGIYLTLGLVYGTRTVGISSIQVGFAFSIAGAVALCLVVPVGRLADRIGSRKVYLAILWAGAAGLSGFVAATEFLSFTLAATLMAISVSADQAARGSLISYHAGGRPAWFRGYLRSVTNLGLSLGIVVGGFASFVDSDGIYVSVLLLGSGTFAVSAVVTSRLPSAPIAQGMLKLSKSAILDGPYMALTLLDGILSLQYRVLTTALPLWILHSTNAPTWMLSAVLFVNAVVVIIGQARFSRHIDNPSAGAQAFVRSGVAFLLSCLLFSLLDVNLPDAVLYFILLLAVLVHTVGEMWHAAAGFELSFSLARPEAIGEYQGVFSLGMGLGVAVGPALLSFSVISFGLYGWWSLGLLFLCSAMLVPLIVRKTGRLREHAAPASL